MTSLEPYRKSFLAGDNSPLKEIYIKHHDDVLRVVASKNMCPAGDIEGYYNESIIILYESIVAGKVNEIKSLKNYLIGTCINLVLREKESKLKIEKRIDQIRLHLHSYDDYRVSEEDNQLLLRKTKHQLSKLSERCQQIIRAYYIDGLTMKEIALYLNLSSGDVAKTLKSRCFKTLMYNIKSGTNARAQ